MKGASKKDLMFGINSIKKIFQKNRNFNVLYHKILQ